ncbi:HAD domain-containing protein [Massilia glaciei]|uniref:HAD family hydrolase n=1 Tax=Massilia glaciei TaxID=1524097 RepID=A0A2U2I6V9_9BURK|nr:HAD domain-containing protein [Massilia glaciei]PWF55503.1 hypothetical protein C7C56_001405 [Massilia glaciei]
MILFLDFDGVLHPEHEREPTPADRVFCHLPRLETILRDFPRVEVVISSMWRHDYTLTELRTRFSPDIAARIIGATPLADYVEGKYVPARRENEILDWLALNLRDGDAWIALDDAVWQFLRHRDRLVACTSYIGFDDDAEARLRAALAQVDDR